MLSMLVQLVWLVHLVSLLHLLLHLLRRLLVQHLGPDHDGPRHQGINTHPPGHARSRWRVGTQRVARLLAGERGLNGVAGGVGRLPWNPRWRGGIGARGHCARGEGRVPRGREGRIGARWVHGVGRVGRSGVGTRLSCVGIRHG